MTDREKLNPKDYIWFDQWFINGREFIEYIDDDSAYFVERVQETCKTCNGKGYVKSWSPWIDDDEYDEDADEDEECDDCVDGIHIYMDWDNYYTEDEFNLWMRQQELLKKRYGTTTVKHLGDFYE